MKEDCNDRQIDEFMLVFPLLLQIYCVRGEITRRYHFFVNSLL